MSSEESLQAACRFGNADRVREILVYSSSGKALSQTELDEALRTAAYHDHPDVTHLLLAHGTRPTEVTIIGALGSENPTMIQQFLDHGLDVNMKFTSRTALGQHVLGFVSGEPCTRLLLEHGANPNVANRRGSTPLSAAAVDPSPVAVMELLISYGAKFRSTDSYILLNTMLRDEHALAATKFVLEHGVDVNAPTRRGPLLHCAVDVGKKEIIQCFLDHGADPSVRLRGETAAEMAERQGLPDLARLVSE